MYLCDLYGSREDNIKMDIQEVGWGRHGLETGYCECGNEPSDSIKSGEFD
jgi:hypothetical protein